MVSIQKVLMFFFMWRLKRKPGFWLKLFASRVASSQEMVTGKKFFKVRKGSENWHFEEKSRKIEILTPFMMAGVNVKTVLTSLNTAFLPISRSRFKQRKSLWLFHLTTLWRSVLCKFLGDFWPWVFWEVDIFSERTG